MQSLTDIGVVREVLSRHGFTFSKALGQNFLVNPTVCPQMVESCGADGQGVLEIGPGIGVLTAELAGGRVRSFHWSLTGGCSPCLQKRFRILAMWKLSMKTF